MSSAEVVGSGKISGGRSNFSQMCTLLSQYLKENGGFGDLKLGLNHPLKPKGSATETMDLFPIIEKSSHDSGSGTDSTNPHMLPHRDDTRRNSFSCGPETAQMTIFYGGQVMVFDDLPAEKANTIIDLARKSSSAQNRPSAAAVKLESGTNFGIHLSAQHYIDSDLPIARKNSLARFLEKRKDRITANAPYPIPNTAMKPQVEAWLGLAPELPLQTQRP